MAALHLRLEEAAKRAVYRPPYAIPLNDPALNYGLALQHSVNVYPHALFEDLPRYSIGVGVTFPLSACGFAPEAIAATVGVLA